LNELFRLYRYVPGQRFKPHLDGNHRRSNREISHFTFMAYLNDGAGGGETRFYSDDKSLRFAVQPQRGAALVFLHGQLHEGAEVVSGMKYVLRSDVMYHWPT
jgi:hypothetical protein